MSSSGSEAVIQPVVQLSRKEMVTLLKERNGILPSNWNASVQPIMICLPVTCALIPKDVCRATGIFSCHRCDMYRTVMQDDGTYKGKSQQEFGKTYRCLYPNKDVLLRPPESMPLSPMRTQEEATSESQVARFIPVIFTVFTVLSWQFVHSPKLTKEATAMQLYST
jgi:hypothetical protein